MPSLSLKRLYRRYWTDFFDTKAVWKQIHEVNTIGARLASGSRYLWYQCVGGDSLEVLDIFSRTVVRTISATDISTHPLLHGNLRTATGTLRGEPYMIVANCLPDKAAVFTIHIYSADGNQKLYTFSWPSPLLKIALQQSIDYFSTSSDGIVLLKLTSAEGAIMVFIDLRTSVLTVIRPPGRSPPLYAIAVQPSPLYVPELTIWGEYLYEDNRLMRYKIDRHTAAITGPFPTEIHLDSMNETSAMNEYYQARKGPDGGVWIANNKAKQILRVKFSYLRSIGTLVNHRLIAVHGHQAASCRILLVHRVSDRLQVAFRPTAQLPPVDKILGVAAGYLIGWINQRKQIELITPPKCGPTGQRGLLSDLSDAFL